MNYFSIHSGNNSTAIQKGLLKRGVWSSLPAQKDYLCASFHWQQLNYTHRIHDDINELCRLYPNRHYLLNHFENNKVITTKSGLVNTLKYYYSHQGAPLSKHIFQAIPTTFIVKAHTDSLEFRDFKEKFQKIEKKQFTKQKLPQKHCQKNIWFLKPESDNQGKGIILSNNLKQIENFLISKPVNSGWIIQKAIEKPFLYNNRKFDIRVWVLVTPQFEVYYYNSPYIRTSSTQYNIDSLNSQIHLTNNCQQKNFQEYSKFEEGNTLPFSRLRDYLLQIPEYQDEADLIMDKILSRMKEIIIDTMLCAKKHFQKNNKKNQFQLFGYDFLIDQDFRAWILEVNNNPYLGTPSKFIRHLMPAMIDQMLEIIVDPYYPPENYTPVATKRFQLLTKQRTNFRIGSVTSRNSTMNSTQLKKIDRGSLNIQTKSQLFSQDKLNNKSIRTSHYQSNVHNKERIERLQTSVINKEKFKYTTPTENLKYLLENYCYVDLDPFATPVNLILSSQRLTEIQCEQANLNTLRLICETRVASILLEEKFFKLCQKILLSEDYSEKIKAAIVKGYQNAAKNFKGKLFAIQKVVPILSDLLNKEPNNISQLLIEQIMKLQIKIAGFLEKVFIPGVTTQNEKLRKYFINSRCFTLLLYLINEYPDLCQQELQVFMSNLSRQNWDLFYDQTKSKGKRAYSPRSVSVLMKAKDSSFNITLREIKNHSEQKQKPYNNSFLKARDSANNKTCKTFRTRRHSGFPSVKK